MCKFTKKYYNQTTQSSDQTQGQEMFQHTLLTSKPATMTQSAQITIRPDGHKAMRLIRSKIKWWAIFMQIHQQMAYSGYPILGAEIARYPGIFVCSPVYLYVMSVLPFRSILNISDELNQRIYHMNGVKHYLYG